MKTRHRTDIKRLSTAISRGTKIAEENGIKHIKYRFLQRNTNEVCGACALGMAYIGKYGLKKAYKKLVIGIDYTELDNDFGTNNRNVCLRTATNQSRYSDIKEIVVILNDLEDKSLEEIASVLKSCKL